MTQHGGLLQSASPCGLGPARMLRSRCNAEGGGHEHRTGDDGRTGSAGAKSSRYSYWQQVATALVAGGAAACHFGATSCESQPQRTAELPGCISRDRAAAVLTQGLRLIRRSAGLPEDPAGTSHPAAVLSSASGPGIGDLPPPNARAVFTRPADASAAAAQPHRGSLLAEVQLQSLVGPPEGLELHMALVKALLGLPGSEAPPASTRFPEAERTRKLMAALACSTAASWINYFAIRNAVVPLMTARQSSDSGSNSDSDAEWRLVTLLPESALARLAPSDAPSPMEALVPGAAALGQYVLRAVPRDPLAIAGPADGSPANHGITVFGNAHAALSACRTTMQRRGMAETAQLLLNSEVLSIGGHPKLPDDDSNAAAAARLESSLCQFAAARRGLSTAAEPSEPFRLALNKAAATASVHQLRALYPLARLLLFREVFTFDCARDDAAAGKRPPLHMEVEATGPLLRVNWIVDAATAAADSGSNDSSGAASAATATAAGSPASWPPCATAADAHHLPTAHVAGLLQAFATMAQLQLAAAEVPELLATAAAGPNARAQLHDVAYVVAPLIARILAVQGAVRAAVHDAGLSTPLAAAASNATRPASPSGAATSANQTAVRGALLQAAATTAREVPEGVSLTAGINPACPETSALALALAFRGLLLGLQKNLARAKFFKSAGDDAAAEALQADILAAVQVVAAASSSIALQQVARRFAAAAGVHVEPSATTSPRVAAAQPQVVGRPGADGGARSALSSEALSRPHPLPESLEGVVASLAPGIEPAAAKAIADTARCVWQAATAAAATSGSGAGAIDAAAPADVGSSVSSADAAWLQALWEAAQRTAAGQPAQAEWQRAAAAVVQRLLRENETATADAAAATALEGASTSDASAAGSSVAGPSPGMGATGSESHPSHDGAVKTPLPLRVSAEGIAATHRTTA